MCRSLKRMWTRMRSYVKWSNELSREIVCECDLLVTGIKKEISNATFAQFRRNMSFTESPFVTHNVKGLSQLRVNWRCRATYTRTTLASLLVCLQACCDIWDLTDLMGWWVEVPASFGIWSLCVLEDSNVQSSSATKTSQKNQHVSIDSQLIKLKLITQEV